MTTAQTNAIQDIIQARNEAIKLLNSAAFNPATRPDEYRAQQEVIADLQAQHATLIAETANGITYYTAFYAI